MASLSTIRGKARRIATGQTSGSLADLAKLVQELCTVIGEIEGIAKKAEDDARHAEREARKRS